MHRTIVAMTTGAVRAFAGVLSITHGELMTRASSAIEEHDKTKDGVIDEKDADDDVSDNDDDDDEIDIPEPPEAPEPPDADEAPEPPAPPHAPHAPHH